ncbi:FAD-binding oxidoreductase [Aspergillus aculeatinus CBS 121060]|uniref:FAD-binding domain-containing protein n=1 Tax=Aspergillus aculeatinus CBS 121060 TaxID=1448322 RepID=A0ACD1H528_9EURO|nr:FAD-binding domain-containing protein [Aspergillus aculeatinus CBS 121060]RAH68511.1 FAD-binding domain-containing protein [Aspergillus aculeatinus CBS 121060]
MHRSPSLEEEVSTIVKILSASANSTFSIRSGGHSPNSGAAIANRGVTIDLRGLNSIDIDSDTYTVQVGTGLTWNEVYQAVDGYDRVVIGGRTGSVGVGGLITGGGISAFSPRYGFACDNVLNMEVVLASGEIVNANASHHADLIAALKGGQNNFGIVTRFDLRSFPQGPYWGGGIQYDISTVEEQLAAFTAFKDPANFDPFAEIEQSYLYYGAEDQGSVSNIMYYSNASAAPASLQRFTDIKPQALNTMRISNTTDFSAELTRYQPMDQYAVYATATFRVSPTILKKVYDAWNATTLSIAGDVLNLTSVLVYQSIPALQPASAPPNSLGIPPDSHPERNQVLCLVSLYWPLEQDSQLVQQATQSIIRAVDALTPEEGVQVPYRYLNYAASWQSPIGSYGPASVEVLQRVASAYDPRGVFRRNVPGGFKLSD